jgi:hypothetical protein
VFFFLIFDGKGFFSFNFHFQKIRSKFMKIYWMKTFLISAFAITITLAGGLVVSNAQVIYDNGTLATGTTSKSGVAAPAGTQWSEIQNNSWETASANTLAGVGCQAIGVATLTRCADDFVIPPGQTWTINSVTTFVYQTGATGPTSPVIGSTLQIWNGVPLAPSSTVLFGDITTNRLSSSTNSNLFRIFNTVAPPPGTAPGTTRMIWQNTLTVSPALVLGPGHYWIDFQTDAGASGNFTPTTTIPNVRGAMQFNALQKITAATTFAPIIETGNPAASTDYSVDFPFKINGSIAGDIGPRRSRTVDFNGDNKTDFAIARSTNASSQTLWAILDSTNAVSGAAWGTGVGFASGDKAVPEDYDGDGKTDIAVWRPGAPAVAAFYILQSNGFTLKTEIFGQTGDDPTVVDDFDGDGKVDVAVYRDGGVGQSFFYYRATQSNPSGNITFQPWGIGGDKPAVGDYDGDRKADVSVIRNSGGSAIHYQLRSTEGFRAVSFGLFADKFAPGDYDGDNKTDICMVRANGSVFDWYILRSSDNVIFGSQVLGGFGNATTDYIVQGDYDGDNRTDMAVWRTSVTDNGVFYVLSSASPLLATKWGSTSGVLTAPDYPVANYNTH